MNRNQNEGIVDKVKDALGMGDDKHDESRDERSRDEPMADEPMYHERTGQEQVGMGGHRPEMSNDPEAETGEPPYGTRGTTERADHGTRRDDDLV